MFIVLVVPSPISYYTDLSKNQSDGDLVSIILKTTVLATNFSGNEFFNWTASSMLSETAFLSSKKPVLWQEEDFYVALLGRKKPSERQNPTLNMPTPLNRNPG